MPARDVRDRVNSMLLGSCLYLKLCYTERMTNRGVPPNIYIGTGKLMGISGL